MSDNYTAKRERIILEILASIFPEGHYPTLAFTEETLRPVISDAVHQGAMLFDEEIKAARKHRDDA